MPIISRVGSRSLKVRLVYGAITLLLGLGAVTMVYPFLLMLAGSTKSEADADYITPYPLFWFDETVLFQKYVESKYEGQIADAEAAWQERIGSWRKVGPPKPGEAGRLDEFLAWRPQCPWWNLGHSFAGRLMPVNARLFRQTMVKRFGGDIDAYRRAMKIPVRSWNMVVPPRPAPGRFSPPAEGLAAAFAEFARQRPVEDRIIPNLDGAFSTAFLTRKYTGDINEYNRLHGTAHGSYRDVLLTRRAPQAGPVRKDWEEYVRADLRLEFIRLDPALADAFRRALARKYGTIERYNGAYGIACASFEAAPFPTSVPATLIGQVDWEAFIKDPASCPAERIEVYGPRQAFEEFIARSRGVPVGQIEPARLPIAAADYADLTAHEAAQRWEFTTRNYKYVLEYVLLHGRGILNTIIYCGLAILTALLVNPIAAYALSRYRPPATYQVLLFCMATMAFPAEVNMIPGFILRKEFPLWPLLGAGAAFGLVLWTLAKARPGWPETLRMTLALGAGIAAGVWAVPAAVGTPTVSLLNTFAALVLPGMANGFFIFLLKGFFDSLPKELYEAADIDGASEWTKFWMITMSLSKPILAVIALGAFTAAYSAFMMALIIIPDPAMWTIMVWLFQLQQVSHQGVVYASLVIAAIPTLLVFVFCQNVIIRGIVVPVEK